MEGSLTGRSILIVEDEPIIVMDITQAFEDSGAELTTTNTLRHALLLVEHDGLSVAILDHALCDAPDGCAYSQTNAGGQAEQTMKEARLGQGSWQLHAKVEAKAAENFSIRRKTRAAVRRSTSRNAFVSATRVFVGKAVADLRTRPPPCYNLAITGSAKATA